MTPVTGCALAIAILLAVWAWIAFHAPQDPDDQDDW